MEVVDDAWYHTFARLRVRGFPSSPLWLELLREAQPKWEGKVEVQASQYGYLSIHRIDDEPPYKKSVTVWSRDGEMVFNFWDNPFFVIAVERATPENAPAVLDAFLIQLTETT